MRIHYRAVTVRIFTTKFKFGMTQLPEFMKRTMLPASPVDVAFFEHGGSTVSGATRFYKNAERSTFHDKPDTSSLLKNTNGINICEIASNRIFDCESGVGVP